MNNHSRRRDDTVSSYGDSDDFGDHNGNGGTKLRFWIVVSSGGDGYGIEVEKDLYLDEGL